jgi:molybdopterin/thiamine biosynthesis adenylyltransferase/ubiquinone/menaquinone biosynthesis C-methylase UbiE
MMDYLFKNEGAFSRAQLDRLAQSRVAVAGLGAFAFGAVNLAQLGVGHLRIADPDTFERHNANRQPLATVSNRGKNKTDQVEQWIRDLVPEVKLEAFPDGVTLENVERFIDGMDVVVDAVDFLRPDVKLSLHRLCREKNIPVVTGLLVGRGAICYCFLHDGPDFEEFFACPKDPELRQTWTMPASRIMPHDTRFPEDEGLTHRAALRHTFQVLNGKLPITSNPVSAGTSHLLLGTMVTNLLLGLPVPGVPTISYCDFSSLSMGTHDLSALVEDHKNSIWTRMAAVYDAVLVPSSGQATVFTDLRDRYVRDLKDCPKILEAGGGTGLLAEALAQQGNEVYVVDRNLEMLAHAVRRARRAGGKMLVGEGDVEDLFFADETFDAYISNNVLYLTNLEKTLREAFRVLKPGGKIALSSPQVTPDLKAIGGSLDRLLASGVEEATAREFLDCQIEMLQSPTITPRKAEEVQEILHSLGFAEVEKVEQAYAGINFYLVARK